jgi:hypothetical protein
LAFHGRFPKVVKPWERELPGVCWVGSSGASDSIKSWTGSSITVSHIEICMYKQKLDFRQLFIDSKTASAVKEEEEYSGR